MKAQENDQTIRENAQEEAVEPATETDVPSDETALAVQPVKEDAESLDVRVVQDVADIPDEKYQDKTVRLEDDTFDFVVPKETFRQHHRRRKRRRRRRAADRKKNGSTRPKDEDDFIIPTHRSKKQHHHHHHHSHHHHHRHRHKFRRLALWKKILIVTGILLLSLIIVLTGTYLVLNEIGRRSMLHYDEAEVTTPAADESGREIVKADSRGHVITYDGVSYALNEDLMSVVFIGADEGTGIDGTGEEAELQMADAIYILTVDTKTGKVKILSVSRDTMADVDVYSEEGKFIDTRNLQMAFAYAYGDGAAVTGGKNTTNSLQKLFYGLPFENYFAIDMNALMKLNDTIGGVTLTSSMTFTSPIDGRVIHKGDTVTLHGKEADYYVRYRDHDKLDSNNTRMQRQQEYIRAFLSSIVPAAKRDISTVTDLYNEIKVNSETTLGASKITYIASTAVTKMRSANDIEYVTLTGKVTEGEYAEMHVSNEDAIRTMLDVFYTPIKETAE